ncbi:MAG: hypothetical protein JO056_04575 [Alphaproteobacteria bacterium]|jgi:hypothetical protein|nr:hypothetical protein [Alphaproteobacteria bacterium]
MQADLENWHDYFVTVAQVSATLAGLLFVGVTISLNHMLQGRGYLYRAWAAMFLQFQALLTGLFALIPSQSLNWLGAELILTGVAVLGAIRTFGHFFPDDGSSVVLGSKGARLVRECLLHVATLLPAVSGLLLILRSRSALYWLVPAEVICLYLSFGNAWVFAVEIPRRLTLAKGPDS